jgi:hypothetical protein
MMNKGKIYKGLGVYFEVKTQDFPRNTEENLNHGGRLLHGEPIPGSPNA